MSNICVFCANWHKETINENKEADCSLLNIKTTALKTCPGWKPIEKTEEQKKQDEQEVNRLLSLGNTATQKQLNKFAMPEAAKTSAQPKLVVDTNKPVQKRKRMAEPVVVLHDTNRPDLELYAHQLEAFERYKDQNEIALFFEMGCGKSLTTLRIAEYKYIHGIIKGLLVIAPNDVHRQWYDELVNGIDKDHDGVMWQELTIDFCAQCVGGRGGQKELYPFERDDLFKFVSVNIDTFSQPHKWEDIVFWANMNSYMIAIDEATVIKNPDSKRSQRLLYEFNTIVKKGKRVIASQKKFPVRAVLTGTPVTNGPMDLWSIMEFVKPNYFNRNYYSFRAYYGMFTKLALDNRTIDVLLTEKTWRGIHDCQDYTTAYVMFGCSEDTYMTIKHQDKFLGPYKHADELKKLLEPVAMFRKLTDCVDMPAVKYINRDVGMSDSQKSVYDSMKRDLLAQYDSYTATATNKLVVNLRLQQISDGFIVGHKAAEDAGYDMSVFNVEQMDNMDLAPDEVVWLGDTNPKLDAIMRDVAECDKPLLIITRYSAEAAKIFELCQKAGYNTGLFTGWKVVGGIDEFKNGNLDILVANSTKISRGFNLQIAHTTLFYSNTFSMEIRQQTEFRTFRMGQKHPCLYIDYTASEADATINRALAMKKNLLEYIRERDLDEVV